VKQNLISRKNFKSLEVLFLSLFALLPLAPPLLAQPYAVTIADDLSGAVSGINVGAAPATIQFYSSNIDLSTLTSPPLGSL